MKKALFIALSAAACLLLASCENSFEVFSNRYPVSYGCDLSLSPYKSAEFFGTFISVRQSGPNLIVTEMNGTVTKEPMTEAEAKGFRMGLCGLIIGTPALDNESCQIFAYDLGCPVCDRSGKRLDIDLDGTASCSSCGTEFDLNNNGFVIASERKDSRPLYRYPVSRNGSYLTVSN